MTAAHAVLQALLRLQSLLCAPLAVMRPKIRGGEGGYIFGQGSLKGQRLYLAGAENTACEAVDGKLRVQIREQLSAELNTTGFVWLADEDDARLDTDYEIFFDQANQFRYDNYDFDITPEEAGSFKLAGFFHILRDPIDGPWEVTFKLQ